MKQIQSVLCCAMLKISPSYSVEKFEEDLKVNLAKYAIQMKGENRKEDEE